MNDGPLPGSAINGARYYREIMQLFPDDPVSIVMLRDLSRSLQPEMPGQGVDELGRAS